MKNYVMLLFCLLLTSGSALAQEEVAELRKVIDTTSINEFRTEHQWKNSLSYQEVYDAARKLFKSGHKVDKLHLDRTFTLSVWSSNENEEGVAEYNLFNGSDGIIGQQVTLILDENDDVVDVTIIGWGR